MDLFEKHGYARTYGELTENGLKQLFEHLPTRKNKVFYDLGSGKGTVVFNAMKMYPELNRAVGIELDVQRHKSAVSANK
jgi:tRNA G46 methylase TrmB